MTSGRPILRDRDHRLVHRFREAFPEEEYFQEEQMEWEEYGEREEKKDNEAQ